MDDCALVDLLKTFAPLIALVGTNIFPILMPTTAVPPAITYQTVGGFSAATLNTSGMQRQRIQFDCFGTSAKTAKAIRKQLRISLNGYGGLLTDGTRLQNANLVNSIDFYNNDAKNFRCAIEFYFYFTFTS